MNPLQPPQVSIVFNAPTLADFILAIQAVQAAGLSVAPSVAQAPKAETSPLYARYTELTGKRFKLKSSDLPPGVSMESATDEMRENAVRARLEALGESEESAPEYEQNEDFAEGLPDGLPDGLDGDL